MVPFLWWSDNVKSSDGYNINDKQNWKQLFRFLWTPVQLIDKNFIASGWMLNLASNLSFLLKQNSNLIPQLISFLSQISSPKVYKETVKIARFAIQIAILCFILYRVRINWRSWIMHSEVSKGYMTFQNMMRNQLSKFQSLDIINDCVNSG